MIRRKGKVLKHCIQIIDGINRLVTFYLWSFPLTLVLLSFYFIRVDTPGDFLSLLFALSIPAYYFVIFLVITILLFPLYLIRHMKYLVVIPKVCLDFYLFVDLFIFNVYRFHIDEIFISLMVHDFHGIGIPAYMIGLLILCFTMIVLLNLIVLARAKPLGRWPALISLAAVFLLLNGQILHAWAYEFHQRYITRDVQQFPCFYPMKASNFIESLAYKFPVIVPKRCQTKELTLNTCISNDAVLQYPLKKIDPSNLSREKYNILFFLLESWRSDMMNSPVTPVISEFATKSYLFTNHLSGGNCTPAGLFSLMYGLHATYLNYVESDPESYPPLLIDVLKENGYKMHAYTSSNLKDFSMKTMFFNGIDPADYVERLRKSMSDDRYVVSELIRSIKKEKSGTPNFWFVFLTSSHHGYEYPSDHEIFKPAAAQGAFLFNKYSDPTPLINRYKNSLHYNDSLFGEVLAALKEAHLDSKTIIIVTSDHGEEFNDKGDGYWGHGSNFTRYQTSVPLILHLPDNKEGHVIRQRSSHIDVAPTLLKYLFGYNNLSGYSNGADLFNLPDHRGLIIKSYNNKAYIIDDIVYSGGIPIDSYDINDINRKNNTFMCKEIELLKLSESCFLTGHPVQNNASLSRNVACKGFLWRAY